jgi:hypothetical protein
MRLAAGLLCPGIRLPVTNRSPLSLRRLFATFAGRTQTFIPSPAYPSGSWLRPTRLPLAQGGKETLVGARLVLHGDPARVSEAFLSSLAVYRLWRSARTALAWIIGVGAVWGWGCCPLPLRFASPVHRQEWPG